MDNNPHLTHRLETRLEPQRSVDGEPQRSVDGEPQRSVIGEPQRDVNEKTLRSVNKEPQRNVNEKTPRGALEEAQRSVYKDAQHGIQKDAHLIQRRAFLSTLAASCAALLSAPALAGNFQHFERRLSAPVQAGQLLTLAQMKTLAALADIIIPKTETASASEVDAHGVIDNELARCTAPEEARKFIDQFDRFCLLTKADQAKAFEELATKMQVKCVASLANAKAPYKDLNTDFFSQLKSMVAFAYYSSEVGGSKELVYDPIPGGYNGYFKLSENNNRAFSMFDF